MSRSPLLLSLSLIFLSWVAPVSSNILVVAPHPDDDILISAGVTYAATQRGEQVTIVYVTNGDANGLGDTRQDEAVLGQTSNLGTRESDLIFLGYPDEGLKTIYQDYPLASDRFLTARSGHSVSYAHRGLGGTDYHNFRFGSHANYNGFNLLADLKDIIDTQRPEHIISVTEFDAHTDHQTASIATKDAILAVTAADPSYVPVLDKMMVWSANSTVWPESSNPQTYFNEPPGLVGTGLSWDEHESLDVPLSMQVSGMLNLKNRALSAHATQGGNGGFIGTFVHKDEFFWPVNVNGGNFPPRVDAGVDQSVTQGAAVQLNGSGSKDPEDAALTYQWRQIAGSSVTLTNSTTAKPSFIAPSGSGTDLTLVFELRVTDGYLNTLPDHVSVRVLSPDSTLPNIAPLATVTVSSQNLSTNQQAIKSVDGIIDGYPGNYTHEWATIGEGVGAWLQLNWSSPYEISRVVLYDRPNTDDAITGAMLTFSSGVSITVGSLNNAGDGVEINVGPLITNSLRVTVTTVSGSTRNIGLSELEVYGIQPTGENLAPIANAGPDQSVTQGASVNLSGTASSDPNGDALVSFRWIQTAGPTVILIDNNTTTPSFTTPMGLSATSTLTFVLIVNDGQVDSAPDPVNITVVAASVAGTNIAPLATVTASSENSGTNQQAIKAVDGVVDGYPGDYTREWATINGVAGSWIDLNWSAFYQVDHVVLYDRPNTNDQITGATLTFSDGSMATVGALNNTGTAVVVNFTPVLTTRVKLTITTVSGMTRNVGLSDIEVYGELPAVGNLAPTANAGPDQTVNAGSAVFLDGRASADPNGDPLTYHWTQTTGLAVALLGANTSTPTFSAPSGLNTSTDLIFTLIVNDGLFDSLTDLVKITVTPAGGNLAPVANAGSDQSVTQGVTVNLNGTASSDPNGDALVSYYWTQTAGPSVTLSGTNTPTPNFTVPVGLAATTTLTFALTVNDGQVDSAPDSVDITVAAAVTGTGTNIAPLATVTASSENTDTNQQATKAVDGFIEGYPGNYAREWATVNGLVGSWLELNWNTFYQVDQVVLYDRPNTDDHITSATLTFSDGSTVAVGSLNNAGARIVVNFTPVLTTRVKITVNTVSGTTRNVGLSEFEVYEIR